MVLVHWRTGLCGNLQWYSMAAVIRMLIRVAVVATALPVVFTAGAAAQESPRGAMRTLTTRDQVTVPKASTTDSFAPPVTLFAVDDVMCGASFLDLQSAEASKSDSITDNRRPGQDKLQGGEPRDEGVLGPGLTGVDESRIDPAAPAKAVENPAFHWEGAIRQSLLFLAISTAFRLSTEPSTRADLKGPFFRDYFQSVKSLRGWDDGDEFLVNYIGHPMEGAVSGFIQVHNDPKGVRQDVGFNKAYWASRLKAFGWAAAFSTQYEIGPLSEASLGNVGLRPSEKSKHPMGYVDLVVTPVLGTAWLVGEDLLDRYVVRRVENKIENRWVRAIVRTLLNPSRSFANMHRGRWFWHRDNRTLRSAF